MNQGSFTQVEENEDLSAVDYLQTTYQALRGELAKVIVGQDAVIDLIIIAILTRSHALLVGVPGLAKTLLISSLARTMSLEFKRIQFTPDLMPSDITGTEMIHQDPETGERSFRFHQGPVFANVVLADEINRTPPKTQAALLEAMQERSVTVAGTRYPLPTPFFVLATQNPVEQEGTYPLPEAQLDRFMFMISVDYPTHEEELAIMRSGTTPGGEEPREIIGADHILYLQGVIKKIPVPDYAYEYALRIVEATRPKSTKAFEFCKKWIAWGAGPRASLSLIMAAKAHALLHGRVCVNNQDIASIAPAVLRHRLALTFAAQSEGVTTDDVTRRILDEIERKA
jgi:MoxR-like ATPase